MLENEIIKPLPLSEMSFCWQFSSGLQNLQTKMLEFFDFGYSGISCDPLIDTLFNEENPSLHYNATTPSLHYSATNPIHSDLCSQPSTFHINQDVSSPSFSEQLSQNHGILLLPQSHAVQSQMTSIQTSMSVFPTEAELTYQLDENSLLWDMIQTPPVLPRKIPFNDFDPQIDMDAPFPSTVEHHNWQTESYQLDHNVTGNGNLNMNEINSANQESPVNCGMKDLSPTEDQSNFPETAVANKTRIRWNQELHECFVQAADYLGGADRATPKNILIKMGVDGLTLDQVKSHLQKYRLAKVQPEAKEDKQPCSEGKKKTAAEKKREAQNLSKTESKTLHMQLVLQKMLHDQLKIIRTMQLQTEENGHRLQDFIEEHNKVKESFMRATQFVSSTSMFPTEGPSAPPYELPNSLVSLGEALKKNRTVCDHAKDGISSMESYIELDLPSHKRARIETNPDFAITDHAYL